MGRTLLFAAWMLALPMPAIAGWASNGSDVTPWFGMQFPDALVTDGSGGAYLFWFGVRPDGINFDRRVLRLTRDGETASGWPVSGDVVSVQAGAVRARADGAGGVFYTWLESEILAQTATLRVGHISSQRTFLAQSFDDLGVVAFNQPVLDPDASSQAFVAWTHDSAGVTSLRLVHLEASLQPVAGWPTSGVAFGGARPEVARAVVPDGQGGAYVLAHSTPTASLHLYRVTSSGLAAGWPSSGVEVRSGVVFSPYDEYPTVPSSGGVIVTWVEMRTGGQKDVFCQRVLETGAVAPGWPADGVLISGNPIDEDWPLAISDGAGGALVAWQYGFVNNSSIYANRILVSGQLDSDWPAGGLPVRLHDNFGILSSLVTDGEGGFITAWLDSRVGCDVYAQRIDSAGEVRWNSNGLRVAAAAAPGTGRLPLLASDESSNAILAWIDTRTGSPLDIDSWDIFATRISSSGAVPSPRIPSAINLETPWPNPTRESSTVWLELAHSQPVRVRVLDAAGRVVRKLSSETRPAGRTVIQWDGRDEDGRDVRQGLYFIQTRVEEGEASARIVVVR